MSESYEIVLQQVAAVDLHALLKLIEMGAQDLSSLAVSGDFGEVGAVGINKSLIDAVVAAEGEVCLTEQLHGFKVLEAIRLPLVLMRVIKYEGKFDIDLSFDEVPSFDIDQIMFAMQEYAVALSRKFNIKEFYGGLEPAADIDTRYFTGNASGPVS
ncbi:hypothetical protein HG549_08155 [Pseudomonas sp. SK]|uniref:hypothetical protein n=1 Tax=Pseudomonas sp. SK TaxID=2729423 RepID=UPI001462B657|nr:hypothetical protein [Pseudomonas sp. SK]QJQ19906.1 hypothetical protein HG549_08155 [Pseudomonas sp. SK]